MTLRRIEIVGFKSFAARTVLDFDRGIAALVGPNGSGKSNVTDAMRWVLGEQNPRLVRGKRSEDVIFAGSTTRQPLGMADVSLVLDNEDGRLDSEFAEVRITRRLYRNGESEYLINGSRTRLRDVSELLMRVGLGVDSYSVIGQGAVDEMILQRAEERRTLLENAADVRRYRVQLAEAASRIAGVEHNLTRCQDVLAELEPLVRRLAQQAERAGRHLELQRELAQISGAWFRHRFSVAESAVATTGAMLLEAEAELRGEENLAVRAQQAELESRQQRSDIEGRLEAAFAEAAAAEREEHRRQRLESDLTTKRAELTVAAEGHRREQARAKERIEEIRLELANAQARCAAERDRVSRSEAEQRERDELQRRRHAELARRRQEAESNDAAVAKLEVKLAAARKRLTELQGELNDRQRELAERSVRLSERQAQGGAEQDELRQLESNAVALEALVKEREAVRRASATLVATAEMAMQSARSEAGRAESNHTVLVERARAFEDSPPTARGDAARQFQRSHAAQVLGTLSARLIVQPGYEAAVAAALGEALEALVLADSGALPSALEWLSARPLGQANFVWQEPAVAPRSTEVEYLTERALAIVPTCGMLRDFVSADESLTPLLHHLLGAALTVSDPSAALGLARGLWNDPQLAASAWVVVTPRGELIRANGVARGGRDAAAEALAGRGRERALARERVEAAYRELTSRRAALAATEEARKAAQQHEQDAALSLSAVTAEARLARQQAEAARKLSSARAQELSTLGARADESRRSAIGIERALTQLQAEAQALEAQLAVAFQAQRAARDARFQAREAVEQAGPALMGARSNLALAQAALQAANAVVTRQQAEEQRALTLLRQAGEALTACERSLLALPAGEEAALAELAARRERAVRLAEQLRAQRSERVQGHENSVRVLDETRARLERRRETHTAALLAARRADDELQRVARDLAEFSGDESVAELGDRPRQLRLRLEGLVSPPEELPLERDPEWLRKRMVHLQREARGFGAVNPNAAEEYREVAQRQAFLKEQSADLGAAMSELRGAMAELSELATRRLLETFEAVNLAFGECFQTLFGGGSANLALSDLESPLEAGVDVVARPPGKKLQSLVALSGGERSLTMIALLLALLKVSPAPFCVLDEVDAALDDANVQRFVTLLRSFSDRTQFVVVTHNRATMEHAERLYGVSMDASGVSKAIAVRLPAPRSIGSAASNGSAAEAEIPATA